MNFASNKIEILDVVGYVGAKGAVVGARSSLHG